MAEFTYGNSWTDICNKALARLGQTRITNLDDGQNGSYCRLHLGEVIEDVFGDHDFNAAKTTVELARLDETPLTGYDYKYALPSDFIRPITFDTGGEVYSLEGRTLLTNAEQVFLTYVARPSDPGLLPEYLKHAITMTLALILTTEIATGQEIVQKMAAEMASARAAAIARDARGNYDEPSPDWYDELR